jgi:hypothetical protein
LALQQWASLPARPRSSLVGLAASVAGENGHDCRWEKVVVQSAMHARQLPECDDGTLKSEPSTKEGEHAATAEVIGVKQPMAGPDRCLNAHGGDDRGAWLTWLAGSCIGGVRGRCPPAHREQPCDGVTLVDLDLESGA